MSLDFCKFRGTALLIILNIRKNNHMKTLDLRDVLRVVNEEKERGRSEISKIGLIDPNAPDDLKTYKNDAILFHESYYDEGTCTIEKPMDEKWANKHKEQGSLLRTHSAMVGVPLGYIIEIKI